MQPIDGKKVGKGCAFGALSCGGGIIAVVAFVGAILYFTVFSNSCARMMGEETYPISGNPTAFDAFAALAEIKAKVGAKAVLFDLDASYVKSDGTMDLNATYKPSPNARYMFMVPLDKAPDDAPPVGAGRGPGDVWTQQVIVSVYQPGQRRNVTRTSGNSRSSYSYTNEGMDIDHGTPTMSSLERGLPDPKLTAQEMWKIAIEKGADKDAVATIGYDSGGYSFTIIGLQFYLYWDKDGKLNENRSSYPGKGR